MPACPKPLPRFEIGENYQLLHLMGEGSYGQVAAAVHKPTGRHVAIKKIIPFHHRIFCLRTLRELKLLRFFSDAGVNENIISIIDIIKPPTLDSFTEIYFVQELMQTDLHRLIYTQEDLTDDHVQYFVYQALRALKFIHSADIIHRDLKPANLLVNANCDLKVCDFGLARSIITSSTGGDPMSEYVATRWYRALEIMLSFAMYSKAIDMWAIGCILAELLSKRPFFPGRDYFSQLNLVLNVLGTPNQADILDITSERSRNYIRALPWRKNKDFRTLFPQASLEAIDFLLKALMFNPMKRFTVEEALQHPYLAGYHDPDDEPVVAPPEPSYFDFDMHKEPLTTNQLKALLYDEVVSVVPSI
ncbi:kinase-like domain-containing protein [Mycena olivaceomarginata]|nr:kinase-like domain-containing protein [Mycena olivaceomarginata]